MGKKWAKEEDAQVIELVNSGMSFYQVAGILRRTTKGVEHRYYLLGHSKKKAFTQKMIDRNRIWREEIASDN